MAQAAMTSERVERAQQSGVLTALPRRARLAGAPSTQALLRRRTVVLPKVRVWRVVLRAARLFAALLVFAFETARDRGPAEEASRRMGARVRRLFERLGGTALKIGQQLAIRVDFLPFELCNELGKLMDKVSPFDADEAIARIEAVAGAPIDTLFERFEREPIGSASIACVYRAKLRDGEEVAIKVRRPGVEEKFVTDLALIALLTRTVEALTLVRPNTFKALRTELRDMFLEELDFHREANFTTLFRTFAKRDRLRFVTAPRVLANLSGDGVLTTEFVHGYSCVEVLRAVDTRDADDLETLRRLGIEPKRVARRIMELSLWMRFECPFFHSDPHPGNIIVLPGGKLVMLDFGACGLATAQQTADQLEMTRRLGEGDISGAAQVLLNTLAPLPDIDIPRLRRALERAAWRVLLMLRSKDAPWWERTSAAISVAMGDTLRDFKIPINSTQLRISRATLLYDTIAYRLDHKLDYYQVYTRWFARASRRGELREDRRRRGLQRGRLRQELASLAETLKNGTYVVNTFARELPEKFVAIAGQGAFIGATVLRAILGLTLLTAGVSVVLLVGRGFEVSVGTMFELVRGAVQSPWLIGLGVLVAYVLLRQIEVGLKDTE